MRNSSQKIQKLFQFCIKLFKFFSNFVTFGINILNISTYASPATLTSVALYVPQNCRWIWIAKIHVLWILQCWTIRLLLFVLCCRVAHGNIKINYTSFQFFPWAFPGIFKCRAIICFTEAASSNPAAELFDYGTEDARVAEWSSEQRFLWDPSL